MPSWCRLFKASKPILRNILLPTKPPYLILLTFPINSALLWLYIYTYGLGRGLFIHTSIDSSFHFHVYFTPSISSHIFNCAVQLATWLPGSVALSRMIQHWYVIRGSASNPLLGDKGFWSCLFLAVHARAYSFIIWIKMRKQLLSLGKPTEEMLLTSLSLC